MLGKVGMNIMKTTFVKVCIQTLSLIKPLIKAVYASPMYLGRERGYPLILMFSYI